MKYRLIKETFPNRTRFSVEEFSTTLDRWCYVIGTVSNNEEECRDSFTKLVLNGNLPRIEVIQEGIYNETP